MGFREVSDYEVVSSFLPPMSRLGRPGQMTGWSWTVYKWL